MLTCKRAEGGFTLVEIMIVVAIIGIIIAIAIPGFMRAREISRALSCQENLMKVEGAVDQYALDNDYSDGMELAGGWTVLVGKKLYLKKTPKCRSNGRYVNAFTVGVAPTCTYSVPGWIGGGGLYAHSVRQHY